MVSFTKIVLIRRFKMQKISYFILTVSEMKKKGKVDDYNLGRAVFEHN